MVCEQRNTFFWGGGSLAIDQFSRLGMKTTLINNILFHDFLP